MRSLECHTLSTFPYAKMRLLAYRHAVEFPPTLDSQTGDLSDPDRWAFPHFREALGLEPLLRAMPSPDTPEGKTALRCAGIILWHMVKLTQATPEEAIAEARILSDKFYCHVLRKPLVKFPHQDGDRLDPGYRMTVALPVVATALFDTPGFDHGVDTATLAALGDELAEFHDTWSFGPDVRFLPVKRLAQFLQAFDRAFRSA